MLRSPLVIRDTQRNISTSEVQTISLDKWIPELIHSATASSLPSWAAAVAGLSCPIPFSGIRSPEHVLCMGCLLTETEEHSARILSKQMLRAGRNAHAPDKVLWTHRQMLPLGLILSEWTQAILRHCLCISVHWGRHRGHPTSVFL